MKLDFLEILHSTAGTTTGRILLALTVAHFGAGLGNLIGSLGFLSLDHFIGSLLFGIYILLIPSIASTSTFFVTPMLIGFTLLFTRYEWDSKTLLFPFFLSIYAGFILA